jgi:hypothetical protein
MHSYDQQFGRKSVFTNISKERLGCLLNCEVVFIENRRNVKKPDKCPALVKSDINVVRKFY